MAPTDRSCGRKYMTASHSGTIRPHGPNFLERAEMMTRHKSVEEYKSGMIQISSVSQLRSTADRVVYDYRACSYLRAVLAQRIKFVVWRVPRRAHEWRTLARHSASDFTAGHPANFAGLSRGVCGARSGVCSERSGRRCLELGSCRCR